MKSVKINVSLASIYEGLRAGLPSDGDFTGVELSKDHQTLELVYSSESIVHRFDFPMDVDDYRKMTGGKAPVVTIPAEKTAVTVVPSEAPAPAPVAEPSEDDLRAMVSPQFAGKNVKISKRKNA